MGITFRENGLLIFRFRHFATFILAYSTGHAGCVNREATCLNALSLKGYWIGILWLGNSFWVSCLIITHLKANMHLFHNLHRNSVAVLHLWALLRFQVISPKCLSRKSLFPTLKKFSGITSPVKKRKCCNPEKHLLAGTTSFGMYNQDGLSL
jgi:hypothetical protein